MSAIFLSYRRDDSAGFAGRLSDELEARLGGGSVFRDVDDIQPGEDFVAAITTQLNQVSAVLVMIGPHWLTAAVGGQRRLDMADDFVRMEIQAALTSGKPVIPLLVDGAAMPAEADLPPVIAALARHQAVTLVGCGLEGRRRAAGGKPATRGSWRTLAGRPWRRIIMACSSQRGWSWSWLHCSCARHAMPAPADVAGGWTAQVKYDWGDQYDERFDFKYLGKDLHGTATYEHGRLAIEQARLKGDWLSFVTRSQEMLNNDTPWKEVTHHYTGQVMPDGIHFTLETGGGYSVHPPIEFVAHRAAK